MSNSDLMVNEIVQVRRNNGSWQEARVSSIDNIGVLPLYINENGEDLQKLVRWESRYQGLRKVGENDDAGSISEYSQCPSMAEERTERHWFPLIIPTPWRPQKIR